MTALWLGGAVQLAYGVTWTRGFEAVRKTEEPGRFWFYIALHVPLLAVLLVLFASEVLS
jgi:hypothetical protein